MGVTRMTCWTVALSFLIAASATTWLRAQTTQRGTRPILTESLVGKDLYVAYCAGCHGRDGKGNGPVAAGLTTPPADLTTIARRHGGTYPTLLVTATLNGTRTPDTSVAHGPSDMPIWGSIFRQLDAKESVARVRVENLVKYLESIQTP